MANLSKTLRSKLKEGERKRRIPYTHTKLTGSLDSRAMTPSLSSKPKTMMRYSTLVTPASTQCTIKRMVNPVSKKARVRLCIEMLIRIRLRRCKV